jgi:hypothetical protein
MVIVSCNSLSCNRLCASLLLVAATSFYSSKPSSPATYKRKKSVSKSSLPVANGGRITRSNLSKHATKLSVKSSLPAANGGQSAGVMMIVSVISPNQSKSNSNVIYLKCVPAAIGGQSAGDTTIVSVLSPDQSKSKSNVIYLKCIAINWLNQDATKKEVCK